MANHPQLAQLGMATATLLLSFGLSGACIATAREPRRSPQMNAWLRARSAAIDELANERDIPHWDWEYREPIEVYFHRIVLAAFKSHAAECALSESTAAARRHLYDSMLGNYRKTEALYLAGARGGRLDQWLQARMWLIEAERIVEQGRLSTSPETMRSRPSAFLTDLDGRLYETAKQHVAALFGAWDEGTIELYDLFEALNGYSEGGLLADWQAPEAIEFHTFLVSKLDRLERSLFHSRDFSVDGGATSDECAQAAILHCKARLVLDNKRSGTHALLSIPGGDPASNSTRARWLHCARYYVEAVKASVETETKVLSELIDAVKEERGAELSFCESHAERAHVLRRSYAKLRRIECDLIPRPADATDMGTFNRWNRMQLKVAKLDVLVELQRELDASQKPPRDSVNRHRLSVRCFTQSHRLPRLFSPLR